LKPLEDILNSDNALIFRIIHRNNLRWILKHGLHCYDSTTLDPHYHSLGNPDLIERRYRQLRHIVADCRQITLVFLMIRFTTGNLLDARAEALVNTVNSVGVMGKGIALMFKEAFPENFTAYQTACKTGKVDVGQMLVTENHALPGTGPKWIINFPTKKHWRYPTQLEWIVEGLKDLHRIIQEKGIRSIAIPPLGCGNGGLQWKTVRPLIESALKDLTDVEIEVYEPTSKHQNHPKRGGVIKLTPARALIADLIRRYWILDIECTYLEAQKLAWFLERSLQTLTLGNPLGLKFDANRYGPYSNRLKHLLDQLDGNYLHCAKRLSDAELTDTIRFDQARKSEIIKYLSSEEGKPFLPALERATKLIEGFETPFGMELLATVDWLISQEGVPATLDGVKAGLQKWPGGPTAAERKQRLFDDRVLKLALEQLTECS
jgi:O-acetyl-ADP-ribose deacetylase (regulator of RNase III)